MPTPGCPCPRQAAPWLVSASGSCCGGSVAPVVPSLTPCLALQEKLRPGYLEQLPGKLKLFSDFLGSRKWFAGEKVAAAPQRGVVAAGVGAAPGLVLTLCPSPRAQLTFVDFLMFDVLDQNRLFEPKCLEPFSNLKDFMERFEVSWHSLALPLPTRERGPGSWSHPGSGGCPVGVGP